MLGGWNRRTKMPYIKAERRDNIEEVMEYPESEDINFVMTTLLIDYVNKKGMTYSTINEVLGVLECVKMEFFRRIAIPVENQQLNENGDVYVLAKAKKDKPDTH